MIPCCSQELLPFLSVMYFFLPPFSTNYSSIFFTSSCHLFLGLPLSLVVPKFPSFQGSFEKFVTMCFYLAWGLAHCKTLNLMGQDFWSGFTPLYDLLSPQLPEHCLPLVWFCSVLLLGGLQPSIGDYSVFQLTSYPRRLETILIIVGTACHCLIYR